MCADLGASEEGGLWELKYRVRCGGQRASTLNHECALEHMELGLNLLSLQ